MRYVGIDVGRKACTASIVNGRGKVVDQFDLSNDLKGWDQLGSKLRKGDRLVLEAGTYVYPLHDHFATRGYEVVAAHPRAVRQITESDKKTDKRDSEILAQLLRVDYLPRAYIPHPELLRERDLLRTRMDIAATSTRLKNRIRAHLARNAQVLPFKDSMLFEPMGLAWLRQVRWKDSRDAVLASLLIEYDAIQARRQVLDDEIARQAKSDPSAKVLMSMPGIDYYLAMVLVAEIGDITRFAGAEAFRAYAGCAPKSRMSAGVNRASGQVTSNSRRLKTALSLVEQTAVRVQGPIKDAYEKRLAQTGNEARAHAVARRKVCDLVRVLLLKRQPCNWASSASHERKLENLDRRARIQQKTDGNRRPPQEA